MAAPAAPRPELGALTNHEMQRVVLALAYAPVTLARERPDEAVSLRQLSNAVSGQNPQRWRKLYIGVLSPRPSETTSVEDTDIRKRMARDFGMHQ